LFDTIPQAAGGGFLPRCVLAVYVAQVWVYAMHALGLRFTLFVSTHVANV